MQTTSCTWPWVVPVGEDPAAHGHWCAFTDLYHTMPYHTCQAGVNSCQVGLFAAPLPRARAAEGGPHTYLRQQITSAETCVRRQGCAP